MTLDVFNEGMFVATSQPSSGTVASYNFDVPTNPVMTTLSTSFTSGDFLFSAIYTDDSEESVIARITNSDTLQAEYENLSNTRGFNIHCFDSQFATGLDLASIASTINDYYYFVLIHSDDHLKHHFARITEIKNADALGDSFDFEPKLGNEIAQGTKFKLFKGPAITSKGVAFTAGLKQDLKTSLQVARPHFWFVNDSLDKDNQLNHNTKYFARIDAEGDGNSIALNTSTNRITFLTVSDYKEKVVDYSKFSLNATSHDTLERLDYLFHTYGNTFTATKTAGSKLLTVPSGLPVHMFKGLSLSGTGIKTGTSGTGINEFESIEPSDQAQILTMKYAAHSSGSITVTMLDNEGLTVGRDDEDYDNYINHANRDSADSNNKTDLTGPTRYLHYDFSPIKNNSTINVIDLEIQESIGDKASYVDLQISDPYRILSKKVNNYDALRIRHMIHRGDFNDWVSFGATINSLTNNADNRPLYSIKTPVDLQTYLNDGDEVLINSRVMIVFDVTASTLRFYQESRLETDSAFSINSVLTSITEDTIIYRRAWNAIDGTLLTGMRMIDGRQDSLSVSLISDEFSQLEATVTSYVSKTGLLTLSLFNQGYETKSALDKMSGQYMIYNEKLNGRITNLKQEKVDGGATVMNINGADKLKELLDPIIEKNTLFSKDIVYSTNSPYNKLTAMGVNATTNFDDNDLLLSSSHSLSVGDKIFAKSTSGAILFLGEIASGSGTTYEFVNFSNAQVAAKAAYKSSTKYTVFNKALSSNAFVSSATSLYGTANKGLFFESGTTLVSGEESVSLPPSSINTTNPKSRGYYLSEAKNMKSDNLFQARLDDNASSKSYATFDTVNTLIDFNILSIKEVDGNQVIEIAPHIPLTLGRVEINYANTQDTTFTSLGTVSTGMTNQRYIKMTVSSSVLSSSVPLVLSSNASPRKYHGKPIFVDNVFVGFMTMAVLQSNGTDVYVYVDRSMAETTTNATVSVLTDEEASSLNYESSKLTHELSLLNGAHLHGGKIITLLNSVRGNSSETLHLDFPLAYDSGTHALTNSDRFGSPYYRIINMEKGNVTKLKQEITTVITGIEGIYDGIKSKVPYYASSYKFNPAFYIDSGLKREIIGTNKFDKNGHKHTLIESRGNLPPSGSNFFDVSVIKSGGALPFTNFHYDPIGHVSTSGGTHEKTPFAAKDFLFQPDQKVSRMFLFINSDLEPYSSVRKDSLLYSGQTRQITNYNILALNEAANSNSLETKQNKGIVTDRISFKDGDYSSSSILSSTKNLADLTRFGMMRLTELCFDWGFNQFDPENPPDKQTTLPIFKYYSHTHVTNLGTLHATQDADKTKLTFTGNVAVADGDLLLDKHGRFIGIADGASSDDVVDLVENRYNTDGISHYTGTNGIYKITLTEEAKLTGVGDKDSFVKRHDDVNMHKGVVINSVSNGTSAGYSKNEWFDAFASRLGGSSLHANSKHNLMNPININGASALIESGAIHLSNTHSSSLFELIDGLGVVSSSAASGDELFMKYWLPVFLDRYSIEDGTSLVSSGMVGSYIEATTKRKDSTGSTESETYGLIGHSLNTNFANAENQGMSTITGTDLDKLADGVFLGFKPRLYSPSNYDSRAKTIGNEYIYRYTFAVTTGEYAWLKFVNLTGTYLSALGVYSDTSGSAANLGNGNSQTYGLNNVAQSHIPYVISHEIDHSEGNEIHIITLDDELVGSAWYRILQPNHTCTYEFSPKDIELNTLSSSYTKMPYEDKTYNDINNYALHNAKGDRTLQGNNEGVLSMYVAIDIENASGQKRNIVPANKIDDMLEGEKGKFCISDGDTVYSSSFSFTKKGANQIGNTISFDTIKETLGVVSVSEITSITVGGESPINTNSKRAMIGSVVSICNEADDLIEELLEEQDTPFTITKETYPLFVAPNFDGISIFEAINFLLRKKDQTLVQKNETFEIKPKDSSGFYNDLLISDNGDIRIYEYEVLDSTFEEYNEIIVNGKSHKSKKQDLRSVKKVGRKTLKVFERKLTTQEEVDTRAKELLILHKGDNKKLRIKIGHNNISQIRVGDVVNVEVKQENIPRNQYIVLEITHLITGLLQLELGKYNKQLEDRFSELTVDVDTTQTLQNTKNNEQAVSLGFLDTVKIKPLKLLVRKRTTTGGATLGFTTALNTGNSPLGFTSGSSITYTDLLEEEF
jgi:hypothetical protein